MRSFIAFLACTGFIVWAHSCETRIVGVKTYAHRPIHLNHGLSFNGLIPVRERPLLFAHNMQNPVVLDALFVNLPYEYPLELDWKR
jgi:hypothetical protein